jgi:tetratricopeptide (TPR) repeat protein
MQMRARRQELHALVVDALEKLYPGEIEHHYGELAYHAEWASLTDRAIHYLPLAGQRAKELYQNAQALDYFTRALALIPEADLRSRFDLLLERVEVYNTVGDRVLQLRDVDTLDGLSKQLADDVSIANAQLQRSNYYFITGDYPYSLETAERVIELAGSEHAMITLRAYPYVASSLLRLGKLDEGMKRANDALALAREKGSRKHEAQMLSGMGLIATEQNAPRRASEYLRKSIEIAREISDAAIESSALNNLGNTEAAQGWRANAINSPMLASVNAVTAMGRA